jgi:hypothetical protein
MIDDKLVEEIYAALVERFGISEIFLPKRGKNRPLDITWKDFIKAALELEPTELYSFCGYANKVNFSKGLKNTHPNIMLDKDGRHWAGYLLCLVGYKLCPECGEVLPTSVFSHSNSTKDGLQSTCKGCDATSREANKEYFKEYSKKYYAANKEYFKEYYESNKHLYIAYSAKRRASKLKATPKWANLVAIKEIYQTCPEGYHVDHIIPLQGKLVCGLHCEFNLQHLLASENLIKGNRFEV